MRVLIYAEETVDKKALAPRNCMLMSRLMTMHLEIAPKISSLDTLDIHNTHIHTHNIKWPRNGRHNKNRHDQSKQQQYKNKKKEKRKRKISSSAGERQRQQRKMNEGLLLLTIQIDCLRVG